LRQLLTLLPDLGDRLLTLKPDLLLELVADPHEVAARLVKLKQMFPAANLTMMVYRRPVMLTAGAWVGVLEGSEKLRVLFGDGGGGGPAADGRLDALVTAQPLLLVGDVDVLLAEMRRLLPGTDPRDVLLSDPGIVTSLMDNRSLSLW